MDWRTPMAAQNDERLYAEDVNYWRTSKSSPDLWLARIKELIRKAGGTVLADGFGNDARTGRAAYMVGFELAGQPYKIVWPILPTKTADEQSAKRQAMTMMYHDVKSRIVSAKVLGTRAAFFSYLMLPDGRTASQVAAPELLEALPTFLGGPHALPPNDPNLRKENDQDVIP